MEKLKYAINTVAGTAMDFNHVPYLRSLSVFLNAKQEFIGVFMLNSEVK